MLLGGIIIILKQLPHAFGYDNDFEGDRLFLQNDGGNTFTALFDILIIYNWDFNSYTLSS
jgi:hypothetical protein